MEHVHVLWEDKEVNEKKGQMNTLTSDLHVSSNIKITQFSSKFATCISQPKEHLIGNNACITHISLVKKHRLLIKLKVIAVVKRLLQCYMYFVIFLLFHLRQISHIQVWLTYYQHLALPSNTG